MKALILIALLVVALAGCGRGISVSDPVFTPYAQQFVDLLQKYNVDAGTYAVDMSFGDPGDGNDGHCTLHDGLTPGSIVIRREAWDQMGEVQRKVLVFHELGHCVLNRKHDTTMFTNEVGYQRAESIMYPASSVAARDYFGHEDEYDAELVKGAKQMP